MERTSSFGSATYVTEVRNRSAKLTYIHENGFKCGIKQASIATDKAAGIIEKVHAYLKTTDVIQLDRTMGTHPQMSVHCRLYISKKYARIAHLWIKSLFDPPAGAAEREPDQVSIYVPEWEERIIFADPEVGVSYILGTDYFGEAKKSQLRKAMFRIKKQGGLGLHAGSKVIRVHDTSGNLEDHGFIMFGLSGTGKTTLTLHDHGLTGDERVIIRQDDVVLMRPDGYCYGTEDGFFIKTEGLEPSQKVLWAAAISPNAAFENVTIKNNGEIDFLDYELTTNGRGVVLRSEIAGTDDAVDLEKANNVIFITRRKDVVPPVAKLTAEQGAAYFMLGESIETSAGDPTKAGQSKRSVGTNPFIVGSEAEEGNRLLEILRNNPDMQCFVLNTGNVGAKDGGDGEKITIKVSTEIMKQIAKGGIEWTDDPDWGYQVATSVEGLDFDKYDPRKYYSEAEYSEKTETLRKERVDWLGQFPGLAPEIAKAVEK